LCLTEHHLKYLKFEKVHIENYNLGAHYCRQLHEKGGVAFLVDNRVSEILICQHCQKQDIEICALKLSFGTLIICVLTLYRAPSGNFAASYLSSTEVFNHYIHPSYTSLSVGT
jgi:hypothetical protein